MSLQLNFAPIELSGETRRMAGFRAYDTQLLQELRTDYVGTHVFRRTREPDEIIDIPVVANADVLALKQFEIDLAVDRHLVPSLLREALVRTFVGKRPMRQDRSSPICVLGNPRYSLVRHSALPTEIRRVTVQNFDVRTLYRSDSPPVTGIVCDVRTNNIIDLTCAELLSRGLDLVGRKVLSEKKSNDSRFVPWRQLAGVVTGVSGSQLLLADGRDGITSIGATEAFLEARGETFEWLIRAILGSGADEVLAIADMEAQELAKGPGRKKHIEEMLSYLKDRTTLELFPGCQARVADLLTQKDSRFPAHTAFPKPTFLFDPNKTRKISWAEEGLRNNGPYDQRWFAPKSLKIAVICEGKFEGRVDAFMHTFLEGAPNVKIGKPPKERAPYPDGFIRRFKLQKPNVVFFTTNGSTAAAYERAAKTALDHANDGGFAWDLAIVQIQEEFKKLEPNSNPYFVTLSALLKRQVPVQNIKIETMSLPERNLVFVLNNLSLATYAKLKGVPWVLATSQTVARELVIGLGSHTHRTTSYGAGTRYVGITSIFSSDGSYLLSDRTSAVPFEGYAQALYETLARGIETVRQQDNWRVSDKVRLVFHVFKPLKDTEVEAVKQTVAKLGLTDVSFAFLHIADDHPWILFDMAQSGIGYQEAKKGKFGPTRGQYIRLGNSQALAVLAGASELKLERHGMPRPVLLTVHRDSTFTDLDYLAQQAFEFAGHSWRVMSPEPVPITIKYSDKLAERLSDLSFVDGWDPDAIAVGRIGRSLWFL